MSQRRHKLLRQFMRLDHSPGEAAHPPREAKAWAYGRANGDPNGPLNWKRRSRVMRFMRQRVKNRGGKS